MTENRKKENGTDIHTGMQPDCRDMWISIFKDSESYLDFYSHYKTAGDYHCFTRSDAGRLISMLHLDASRLFHHFMPEADGGGMPEKTASHLIPAHYIVGVATEPSRRRRGLMASLLKDAFAFLFNKGEAFTYLMPADAAIYEPFGFRFIYAQEQWKGGAGFLPRHAPSPLSLYSFSSLGRETQDAVIAFANSMLSARFQLFAWRDARYYEAARAEAEACGGGLFAAFTPDRRPAGLLTFMTDEGSLEITEGIYREEYASSVLRRFLSENHAVFPSSASRLSDRLCFTETAFLPSALKAVMQKEAPFTENGCIMARVISFPAFASLLRSHTPEKRYIALRDGLLADNNGLWELETKRDSAACRRLSPMEKKAIPKENVVSLEIADAFSYFLPELKVFLNEFV